jgi:hypothetical protein
MAGQRLAGDAAHRVLRNGRDLRSYEVPAHVERVLRIGGLFRGNGSSGDFYILGYRQRVRRTIGWLSKSATSRCSPGLFPTSNRSNTRRAIF